MGLFVSFGGFTHQEPMLEPSVAATTRAPSTRGDAQTGESPVPIRRHSALIGGEILAAPRAGSANGGTGSDCNRADHEEGKPAASAKRASWAERKESHYGMMSTVKEAGLEQRYAYPS